MPDDYRFTVEDEIIYRMFLETTTTIDVTTKDGFLFKLLRLKYLHHNKDIVGIIKRVEESTEEEFQIFKSRCLR